MLLITISGARAGTFPFDHTENPDPNCKEAHSEVWAQQTKGSWSEVPHIKKAVQKVRNRCRQLQVYSSLRRKRTSGRPPTRNPGSSASP